MHTIENREAKIIGKGQNEWTRTLFQYEQSLFLEQSKGKGPTESHRRKSDSQNYLSEIEDEFNEESLNLGLFNILNTNLYRPIALLDDFYGRCLWLKEKSSQSELEQKLAVAKK